LTLLVDGEARNIDACRNVFDVVGERVFHLDGIDVDTPIAAFVSETQ
jgi:hypothetical protein